MESRTEFIARMEREYPNSPTVLNCEKAVEKAATRKNKYPLNTTKDWIENIEK